MNNYKKALVAAKSGRAVFILGAGFSKEAKNYGDKNLFLGSDLKKFLSDKIGISLNYPLEIVSQNYVELESESKLLDILKSQFLVKEFPDYYNCLSDLKNIHFYTTNYDDLIEKIFINSSKKIQSYQLCDKLEKVAEKSFILHINGKVMQDTTSIENLRLTLDSYDKTFFDSPWIKFFSDDLQYAEVIFILGYSLVADLDLRRILKQHKNKCYIIQHPNIDISDVELLKNYGTVIENGIEAFLSDLRETKVEEKKDYDLGVLKSFKQVNTELICERPSDQQVFDFLIKGSIENRNIFYQNIDKKFEYLVNRRELFPVIDAINQGLDIIIHSDLGNGKTIFLHQLARLIKEKKILQYEYNSTSNCFKEIRKINESKEKTILVFDPYNTNYDLIKTIKNLSLDNIQLLLIARTAMHENFERLIDKDLGILRQNIFDLNCLNEEECIEVNKIFEKHGLWGKDAAVPEKQKIQILMGKNKCKGNFQNIILYLFERSEIKDKFVEIIKHEKSTETKKLLLLSFINAILQLQIKDSDFNLLYDFDVYKKYNTELFKEFAYFDRNQGWTIKSPIIAKSMVKSCAFNKSEIIKILIELTIKIDKLYNEEDEAFLTALKNLASCSYLSFIFDYDIDKNELLSYFEGVKETSFNKRNYFFWMQYAIACVNTCEYERAKIYFDTAYSFANRKGKMFSTFQIDNHYARFLLERQLYTRNPNDAFTNFERAHRLLLKSQNNDLYGDRYYQFRVAKSYKDYYDTFYDSFTQNEKRYFVEACRIMLENVNKYFKEVDRASNKIDVVKCRENLRYIINTVSLKEED